MDNILNVLIDNLKMNDEKYNKLSKSRQIFNKIIDLINIINYKDDNKINNEDINIENLNDLSEENKEIFLQYYDLLHQFKNKDKTLTKIIHPNGKIYYYNRKATCRKYYLKNKEKKVICNLCGMEYRHRNRIQHENTLKCKNNRKNQCINDEITKS